MHVTSTKFLQSAKDFIKESIQEPVFIEDSKGHVKAVLLSVDEFQEFRLLKKRLLQNDIQQGLDELDSGKGSLLDMDVIIQRCKAKKAKSKRG